MELVALLQMSHDDGECDKADGKMSALVNETFTCAKKLQEDSEQADHGHRLLTRPDSTIKKRPIARRPMNVNSGTTRQKLRVDVATPRKCCLM